MKLSHDDKLWLAELMNRLEMVQWDRLTGDTDGSRLSVYGWIDRRDGRHDYVELTAWWPERTVGYTTSSAEYSEQIGKLLYGPDVEHIDCERVEHVLQGLVENVIHL